MICIPNKTKDINVKVLAIKHVTMKLLAFNNFKTYLV